MSPEVEQIFLGVADLDPDAKAAYYDSNGVTAEIRREVDSLLAYDHAAPQFLVEGLLSSMHEKLYEDDMSMPYGPYRMIKPIGSGGMGTVYLAERADGEIVQKVAVKILRDGHRDMDRVTRFLRERQILASLQHPYISRLIDAGHREDGQPYLVMDYVDGKPLDEHATDLTLRAKLELILEICEAVSYAHRNLVIHRDLKPGNILVDTGGHPHLLDFGIARILDNASDVTVTGQRMLTPDYSSPEQVSYKPVTTAADIYSLGGILYKLLTGAGPHEFEGSTPEGLLAAIEKRDPVRPSQLAPELEGDLDLILMKALRKDPEERYHTVDEFAADVRAYLESRPISARKDELTYRFRKFLRRYWIPSLAATVATIGLVAAFVIANQQRTIAQRRFNDVRQLSNRLLALDTQVQQLPGSTRARQIIVETSVDYLKRLEKEAHGDPELALELGTAYQNVARVQGVSIGRNLGQTDLADQSLRQAEMLIDGVLALQPSNREAMFRAAQVAHDRMILVAQKGGRRDRTRRAELLAFAHKSSDWLQRLSVETSDTAADEALGMYRNIADQYLQCHQAGEALQACARGSTLARSLNKHFDLGMFYWVTAEVHQQQGELEEARKAIDESVRLIEQYTDPAEMSHKVGLAHVLIWRGRITGAMGGISQGIPEVAIQSFERAFQIVDPMVHADPNDQSNRVRLGMAGVGQAAIIRNSKASAALDIYEHLLRHLSEIRDNAAIQRMKVEVLAESADPLRRLGRSSEARKNLDRAFEILKELKLYPDSKVVPGSGAFKTLRASADFDGATGNPARALEIYRRLIEAMRKGNLDAETQLEDAVDLSNVYRTMSDLHRQNREPQQAEKLDDMRMALWNEWARKAPENSFVRRQMTALAQR